MTNIVSPVCFCLVSVYAIFTIQRQFLAHVHCDIIKGVQAETLVRLEEDSTKTNQTSRATSRE